MGGADELYHTDGVSITTVIFSPGTVSLGSIKYSMKSRRKKRLDIPQPHNRFRLGLSRLFSEHLSKQGMTLNRVEEFSCYEGGIGGTIKGEASLPAQTQFMNLMGIKDTE